jgi:hypothetical protein
MELEVKLSVELRAGERPNWIAQTNRFHYPEWAGTAFAEATSPTEALTKLDAELQGIAERAYPKAETVKAAPLERVPDDD